MSYNAITTAIGRVEDRALVSNVIIDTRPPSVRERLVERLSELERKGQTADRTRLAEDLDCTVPTITVGLSKLRQSSATLALVERVYAPANTGPLAKKGADRTEREDTAVLLHHVDAELAAIVRDRVEGQRLHFRLAGLRSAIADAL